MEPPKLKESPSQTAGPYVHIGCTPSFTGITDVYPSDLGASLKTGPVEGTEIVLSGIIFDGNGDPVLDAMIEIWQPDAAGLFNAPSENRGDADPHFTGWGRCASDPETGEFRFETVKPGQVPFGPDQMQAPHICLWIVARGINIGLQTRAYFEDEDAANATDPILCAIATPSSVDTLIAKVDESNRYRFDIHLQGPRETVFFDM